MEAPRGVAQVAAGGSGSPVAPPVPVSASIRLAAMLEAVDWSL